MGNWYYFGKDVELLSHIILFAQKSVAMKKTILINLLLILAYYLFLQLLVAAFIRG
jgi:hypothetical protein